MTQSALVKAALIDQHFADETVTKVVPDPEGKGWTIGCDGWGIFASDQQETGVAPEPGDTVRLWGKGFGYTVRGIGLLRNGRLIALYRYQTADQADAAHAEWVAKRKREQDQKWSAEAAQFAARVKALPEPFQQRIEFFMRRPSWGPEFGGYEMFACEEAVKIATYCVSQPKILELNKSTDMQKAAGISDEHSGNTFGAACVLAQIYVTEPALVPKAHGALCPMVGCKEYGCFASLDKGEQSEVRETR